MQNNISHSPENTPRRRGWTLPVVIQQFNAMMLKNWLFTARRAKLSIVQLFSPILFIGILLVLDLLPKSALDNPYNPLPRIIDQPVEAIGSVAPCREWNGQFCKTVRYGVDGVPNSDTTTVDSLDMLMKYVADESGLDFDRDFERVGGKKEFLDFVLDFPNITTNGLIFSTIDPEKSSYRYTLFHNTTYDLMALLTPGRKPDNRNELHIATDRAIFKFHNDHLGVSKFSNISISYNSQLFPQLGFKGGKKAADDKGPVFFYCGIMFQAIIVLYNVCQEKDLKLRQGLTVIGLKDAAYWWSWVATGVIFVSIAVFFLISAGYAFSISFFTEVDLLVNIVLYTTFGLATIGLVIFTSVFIHKAKSSLNAGMLHFILGLLLVSIMSKSETKEALFDPETVWPWVPQLLSLLFPAFNLGAAICEVDFKVNENNTFYHWDNLYEVRYKNRTVSTDPPEFKLVPLPTANDALLKLLINFLVFAALGFYLDQVLSGPNGEPRHFYFVFDPRYWFGSANLWFKNTQSSRLEDANSDSSDETQVLLIKDQNNSSHFDSIDDSQTPVLQIVDLKKDFTVRDWWGSVVSVNKALDGVSFCAYENQVLAVLGHNGAGKSTAINIVTGLMKASGGEAFVDGLSVKNDLDAIRKQLGVCPQHDIIWDELTAEEHIRLIARIKQVPSEEIEEMVTSLLKDVDLEKVAQKEVGKFSGGMKRRLSVAMSFVGNPRLVILDEPSTGTDALIKRDLWDLVLRMKRGRTVVFTSHDMFEADVLGDDIVIMSHGKVETQGTPIQLKNNFAGYRLSFNVPKEDRESAVDIVNAFVQETEIVFEKMVLLDDGRVIDNITVALPPSCDEQLIELLKFIEAKRQEKPEEERHMFDQLTISQTSLEDVFLRVTDPRYSPSGRKQKSA